MASARRYWPIWAVVVPIVLWVPLRLFGLERGFPLVPLVAYTPYAALAAVFVAGTAVALRNWAAAAVSALAVVFLMAMVLPRAVGSDEELPSETTEFGVLSANIHHGTADPAALVALVDRLEPDLLSVQELTPDFARRLAAAGIGRALPHALLSTKPGASGGGLYSRFPMRPLSAPPPVAFRMPRALVTVPGRAAVRVVEVHPYPPVRGRAGVWRAGLESLPAADSSGPPWILPGDFNATLDFAALRDLVDTGYRDAGAVTGEGLEPTWPQGEVFPPPVTIDHILADERITIAGYSVEDLPGSDHRAVFARLGVP